MWCQRCGGNVSRPLLIQSCSLSIQVDYQSRCQPSIDGLSVSASIDWHIGTLGNILLILSVEYLPNIG